VSAMRLTMLGGSAAGAIPGSVAAGFSSKVVRHGSSLTWGPTRSRNFDAISISERWMRSFCLTCTSTISWTCLLSATLSHSTRFYPRRLPIWLPPGGQGFLDRLATDLTDSAERGHYISVFDAREYHPGVDLRIGDLQLRFQQTVHYTSSWATRVSNGSGRDLHYTADSGAASNVANFSKDASEMVTEGSERGVPQEPTASRGHLTPTEAGTLARNAGANTLILSHLWEEKDPFSAVQEAEAAFGGREILATPGFRLRCNQKHL
jgi:hypothetical protein